MLPIKTFFDYHALSGGSRLSLFISGNFEIIKFKEFEKITCLFSLPESDKKYRQIKIGKQLFIRGENEAI